MADSRGSEGDSLSGRVARAVEGLTPGYFALVMATGIISVGLSLEGFVLLSRVLLVVCVGAFVVLLSLTLWRFAAYRGTLVEDFMDPRRAFGFFTFVAGTNVLGVRHLVHLGRGQPVRCRSRGHRRAGLRDGPT